METKVDRCDRLAGCLIGGAIGDALGLSLEGISRARASRLFPSPLKYRFLFGRGMVSDDTEHACITGLALARAPGDPDRFARQLANGLHGWLCTLPAGVGLATLKATMKLMVGVPPSRSGVWSAGNGAAMRAPIIGAYFGDDTQSIRSFVEASSLVTHRDPRAIDGAYLVAVAASGASIFEAHVDTDCWQLQKIKSMLERDLRPSDFADAIGCQKGVGGFVAHTVPVALYCALWSKGDFRLAIEAAAALGGDSDTLCAIVGGIVGARVGADALPSEWVRGIWEWPRSVGWMKHLARSLADGSPPPKTFWPAYLARSPLFIGTVLAHGFRRVLPPY